MKYAPSALAVAIFSILVAFVLGLSFFLARKTKSAKGYYAAHGQIPWFVNGVAFAGDYLSAASFLGICGYIAFFGYDGFLYSIGYLAGWVVALLVIAEPIKRLGKFTFADALDSQFHSSGIKLAAAISTLIVSIFYLIPQMVGAGQLIKPLLGYPYAAGVIGVGIVVILIVTTAGMVSTTWVQFIKGSLLVLFCLGITIALMAKGLTAKPAGTFPRELSGAEFGAQMAPGDTLLPETGPWEPKSPTARHYIRVKHADGSVTVWLYKGLDHFQPGMPNSVLYECQLVTVTADKETLVNGLPQVQGKNDLHPVGYVERLPEAKETTGPLGPLGFLATIEKSSIGLPRAETAFKDDKGTNTIYYNAITSGEAIMAPGLNAALFPALQSPMPATITPMQKLKDQLNFLSLMMALFCGTAALPHILIRYYTVKDQASARKSTVVGIGAIGLFYILTLFMGLGAMTSLQMDPTNNTMAAPLLAKEFGDFTFALVSAIAFTTVLGTVSGLIIAASGAVAHDLLHNLFKMNLDDHAKVRAGKIASVVVGIIAICLGIVFEQMNPTFLVGWAFNVAASANLPAITMLLFWKRTTKQGIAASITVGLISSLTWIFLSADAYTKIYGMAAKDAPVPFSQPAIVTIPLAYLVLIVVSLMTKQSTAEERAALVQAGK